MPSYNGCQSRDGGQRDDSARWSHNALEAHPAQAGRRCHERQQEGKRGDEQERQIAKRGREAGRGGRGAGVPSSSANGMDLGV